MTRVEETQTVQTDSQLKRFKALAAILVVALVVALVAVGLLVKGLNDARGERDDAKDRLGDLDAAEAAARELLVDMTTYDYKTVGATYDWLDQLTNSAVKKNFEDRQKDIEKVIRLGKVTAKGEVEESAYRPGADGKTVVVIAFVHQTITDKTGAEKAEDQWATFTMVPGDSDSGWLAQNIQLSGIPNPAGTVTEPQ